MNVTEEMIPPRCATPTIFRGTACHLSMQFSSLFHHWQSWWARDEEILLLLLLTSQPFHTIIKTWRFSSQSNQIPFLVPNTMSSNIAHFQGGRNTSRPVDEENVVAPTPSSSKANSNNFDNDLPEGVDFSQGGWATDFAASLTGLLFFISGLVHYNSDNAHVLFLHAGTAVAHFFGGLAHRYFPNRASDGVGMTGFYVTMVLGYGGNCVRLALGWDLTTAQAVWPVLGAICFVYLVLTATWTVCRMQRTNAKIDTAQGVGFKPDSIYAVGELAVAILEVTTGVIFLLEQQADNDRANTFATVAVVSNLLGWFAVYGVGGFAFVCGFDYNPGFMQRIFHYAMIIMLWAMNEYALEQSQ